MIADGAVPRQDVVAARPRADGVPMAANCSIARRTLEAIYRDERHRVLAYLAGRVGREHAGDLAQEVFLRAAASSQLTTLNNPGGFLRRIARNLAVDFSRRRRCRIVTVPMAERTHGRCRANQADRIIARDAERIFDEALDLLPKKTARVFALSRLDGKSHRQIGLELGISQATVEYHMGKAFAHFRQHFARNGHDTPAKK